VFFVSPFVPGEPVTGEEIARSSASDNRRLARSLAEVLVAMHHPDTLAAVVRAGVQLPAPVPQATTTGLQARLCPMLDRDRRALVQRWCDWIDGVLTAPADAVVLHGDFHGYNVVVDHAQRVRTVLDLEEAARGDRHYDFRYLPAQEATLDLFLATAAEYERLAGVPVDVARVMAWHVRSALGDALWRTEAGIALPGGGTKEEWIAQIGARFSQLGIDPS
jgi:aminoglycoside phosphotransferase (APT) family kinase protein